MSKRYEVAVVVGSLRKESLNRRLAHALIAHAPSNLSLEIVEIRDLPFYNEDLERENPVPRAWTTVRSKIAASDGVLFVTPEYNRSVPAVLKNAVDVLSRPFRAGALANMPAAVVSTSPGALGGFGANQHLRQSLACLNVAVMPTPEVYLSGVAGLFDETGKLKEGNAADLLRTFLQQFEEWVSRLS
ncbi:NADPH-dependent FMN reductase [Caballeronia arvi]|uniref:NADPH-dependent FMN reductase n=1 Tax=Caballeronia arvi TaxID=1777135 RepID=A0A158J458_9BURK|nr:NAD(P)H-dependent oxidoreductase [Caballeronia arvi]SAL63263.1 NADPH-dependent FMN reductase [Caballeronia arvi]